MRFAPSFKRRSKQACAPRRSRLERAIRSRRISVEPLEDRRLLAVFTVTTTDDELDPNPLTDLMDVSLREAIAEANKDNAPDTINFATSGTINLEAALGQLSITNPVTISDVSQDAIRITVDADNNSRVFDVTAAAGDVTFEKIRIQDGETSTDGQAGAGAGIRFLSTGTLTVIDSELLDNETINNDSKGGAIFSDSGDVVITGSKINSNKTRGDSAGGAGISVVSGDLEITDSEISNNYAYGAMTDGGGISQETGELTLTRSVVANNGAERFGGGISSFADITLNSTAVRDNAVSSANSQGGGISTNGSMVINNSTISGNETNDGVGGGVRLYATAAGASKSIVLTNSTVDGNSAGGNGDGGGIWANVDVILNSSTVTSNEANGDDGGGIFIVDEAYNPELTATNSIIALNTANDGVDFFPDPDQKSDLADMNDVFDHINNSFIGNNKGTDLSPSNGPNIIGADGAPIDPLLGPLTENGGPTMTRLPRVISTTERSRVIDAGDSTLLPTNTDFDQRGTPFARVVNGGISQQVDMGAVEFVPARTIIVNALNDETTDTDGMISLREAIILSNASAEQTDTIEFDPGLTLPGTITLTQTLGEMTITDSVNIQGPGADQLTIDANQQSRLFNIFNGMRTLQVSLEGMTLTGGKTTENSFEARGGAIFMQTFGGFGDSRLLLKDSVVTGNTTEGNFADGGAIYSGFSITLQLDNTAVTNNFTTGNEAGGGAIYTNGPVLIENSTISGNRTEGDNSRGGGLNHFGGESVINNSTISGNTTQGTDSDGGGIYSISTLTLTNSTISGNQAYGGDSDGGGIYSQSSILNLFGTTVADNDVNVSQNNGGGVFINAPSRSPIISNSIVANNETRGSGVGPDIFADESAFPLLVNHSLIGTKQGTNLVPSATPDARGNLIGDTGALIDPGLNALADNGGPTLTRALLPGSAAINAGDPNAADDSATTVLAHGPSVFWQFEETNSDATTADDSVGSNDATYNGVTLDQLGAGVGTGRAIAFDSGDKDTVTKANLPVSELGGDSYSVALWFNTTTTAKQTLFSASSDGPRENNILVELEASGEVRFENTSGATRAIVEGQYTTNFWHHVVAVRDGATMRLYLDGVELDDLTNATGTLPAQPLDIVLGQQNPDNDDRNFDGRMDNVAIFNDALTAEEIAQQFASRSVSDFDQRGTGFPRIVSDRIDMGAFESTPPSDDDFIVTVNADIVDFTDDDVTLREAILSANSLPDANEITFAASLTSAGAETISLLQVLGELKITQPVTITGPGADLLTIDGGTNTRIFNVDDGNAADINVAISGLTLTGGNADDGTTNDVDANKGGAILNLENLTVSGAVISSNTAKVAGGGIFNKGTVSVSTSTISENSAVDGAAIATIAGATTNVSSSTISGNTATGNGGGILNVGPLTAVNTTIAGNSANIGGGIHNSATATLTNITVAGNSATTGSAGLFNAAAPASMTINNSIVLANTPGGDVSGPGALAASSANNVVGSGLTDGTNNNVVASDFKTVLENDGTIPTLQDNGGPTATIAILATGAALDAGDSALLPADVDDLDGDADVAEKIPFDQRGTTFLREVGDSVDAGAYELQDTRPIISVTVAPASAAEASGTDLVFTFARTGDTTAALTVPYTITSAAGSATAGTDYTGTGTSIDIPAGSASADVTVVITDDTIDEVDETVELVITPNEAEYAVSASEGSATATITDDDLPSVSVTVSPGSVAEDGSDTLVYTFTQVGLAAPLTVTYTVGGDATRFTIDDSDGSIDVPADGTATVTVTPTDNAAMDGDESVVLTISENAAAYVITGDPATGTITDDEAPQMVTIDSTQVTLAEGNSGTTDFEFTVTRSDTSTAPATVSFAVTGSGTNPATADDFDGGVFPTGTVTFNGTDATATITIAVAGDTVVEADEGFTVTLTGNDVVAAQSTSTGEITNDDAVVQMVTIDATPVTLAEGNTGTTGFEFTVTRSDTSMEPATVTFAVTGSGSDPATADDFEGVTFPTGTVTFAGTEATATVTIPVAGDTTEEPNEGFTVTLTGADVVAAQSTGTGVITNDDGGGDPVVVISPDGPGGDPDPLPGTTAQPSSWEIQRSSLRQISVQLPITPAAVTAADLELTNLGVDARPGGDADVVIDTIRDDQLVLAGNTLTINLDANQLPDGVYQLELKSALTGGASFTLEGSRTNGLFVLKGDWNGSGAVTVLDFATFSYWFSRSVNTNTNVPEDERLAPEYVDLNASGAVTVLDFAPFSNNFSKSLNFPGDPAGVTATVSLSGDVNGDGAVTTLDAVQVINALNDSAEGEDVPTELDANQDGKVTASDALFVINRLDDEMVTQIASAASDDDSDNAIDQLLGDESFLEGLF